MNAGEKNAKADVRRYAAYAVVLALMAAASLVLPVQQDNARIDIDGFDHQSSSIVIRNTGAVVADSIDVYVDGVKVSATYAPLEPGRTGEVFLGRPLLSGTHIIGVVSSGYRDEMTVNVPEGWFADFQIVASE